MELSVNNVDVAWPADHVNHYQDMHWEKVCTVQKNYHGEWFYTNIDKTVLYSDHRSWVYFITENGFILKVGETGNPLGIETAWTMEVKGSTRVKTDETQPMFGSKSRLGRYRNGGDTDERVREELSDRVKKNNVEFWAYRCPECEISLPFPGESAALKAQIHKQLEKWILDYIKQQVGQYPELNKGRC